MKSAVLALELVACNLCGSSDCKPLLKATDVNHGLTDRQFLYVKCSQCGLVYQNPRVAPQQIGEYYPPSYSDYRLKGKGIGQKEIEALEDYKYNAFRKEVKAPGKVLDVGAGEAKFLSKCLKDGFEAYGNEFSKSPMADEAAKQGIHFKYGDFMKLDYPDQFFDSVTFWQVLEHLPDPMGALKKAHNLLKRSGQALVSVPNAQSLQGKLFGRHWSHVDAPRHYYLFSPKTLREYLEKAGFKVDAIHHLAYEYNAWGYGTSLLNIAGKRKSATSTVPSPMMLKAGKAATFLPTYFEAAIGMGGTILAVAHRA